MLSKTRTTIITLVASASFATAAALPAVSQAKQPIKKITPVTCPNENGSGQGSPGDIVVVEYNVVNAAGDDLETKVEKRICGKDGKWHTVVNMVQPGTGTLPPVYTSGPPSLAG